MTKFYKEFPDIAIPELLKDWDDVSWHNDVTASSILDLGSDAFIRVWVAHEDPKQREFETFPRFLISVENSDGDFIITATDDGHPMFQAQSETELEKNITSALRMYGETIE